MTLGSAVEFGVEFACDACPGAPLVGCRSCQGLLGVCATSCLVSLDVSRSLRATLWTVLAVSASL